MLLDRWERVQDRIDAKVAEAGALAHSGRPLTVGWLAQTAAWVGEIAPTWVQLTGAVPLQRSYLRLASSPHLEAWLICWPTDVQLQLHDHGGASGAFQVIDGVLDERSVVGGVGGTLLCDRGVVAGETVSFDGAYIHDVRNTRRHPATSVHMYGPASSPMNFYRLVGGVVGPVDAASARALREAEGEAEGRAVDRGQAVATAGWSRRAPAFSAAAQHPSRSASERQPSDSRRVLSLVRS